MCAIGLVPKGPDEAFDCLRLAPPTRAARCTSVMKEPSTYLGPISLRISEIALLFRRGAHLEAAVVLSCSRNVLSSILAGVEG